jgi:adenosylhomocysteine nucleosidase
MEKKPILIIGAMNTEINYLVSKIENCKIVEKNSYKFYEGTIKNYPVVLAKTNIGLVNASSCITLAIEKYNPLCIINEGTAGGITESRHKKDIIIGTEVFNINSYKTPYKELGEGTDSRDWELMTFTDGGVDEKVTIKSDEKLAEIAFSMKNEYEYGNVYKGIIGSGDVWNREKDKLKYLDEVHNVSCEDMESIAIYTVAKNYNLPVLAIKIMSDNELLGEEYEPKVALYCQEFVEKVIVKLIENGEF